MKTGSLVDPAN